MMENGQQFYYMYNIYKYQEDVKAQESLRHHDENYTKWLLRHEEMKSKAAEKMKTRVNKFLMDESFTPTRLEDDHYKTWRYNKQFRDIEDSNNFVGFKTFRHRPHYDMDKYYTERERKEISFIADKSMELVKSNKIANQLRSRSLRSQGPLNPKHTFRDRKSDKQYLNPHMRFQSITDKERINQASVTYDDKFSKLYQSFNMTKSKIGQTKISPSKNISRDLQTPPHLQMMESTYSDVQKNQRYHYESPLNQEEHQLKKSSQKQIVNESVSPSNSEKRRKVYFKTAKTLAVHGDKVAKQVMIESQYDRKKDLTNLQHNLDNESFVKRPIL